MIESDHSLISISRQCQLIGLNRSSFYARTVAGAQSVDSLKVMKLIDQLYTSCPFYGSRRIAETLKRDGYSVNRKRIQRLMRLMGLHGIELHSGTSSPAPGHKIFPYLLRGVHIERPNQVWSTDITYVPMNHGFMYLTAVIDWHSRYVLSWELSNTLTCDFCIEALMKAFRFGKPEIFNTDQGSQFTSNAFTSILQDTGIAISMDGRGRALDNVFIERFWRSIKYEDIYLKNYDTVYELYHGINTYMKFYNQKRLHQSLDYQTPGEVYLPQQLGKE
jgi:putative transposase